VLTREPFEFLFFIDAPDADKASFSPDSKSVIFKTPSLRVEVWDIASQKRMSVHEILQQVGCLQSTLSPDGNYLACLDRELTLQLVEVTSGKQLAAKKDFVEIRSWSFFAFFVLVEEGNFNLELARLRFSPDGHYFLAGGSFNDFAYDLKENHEAKMPSSIRNAMHGEFTFVSNEHILGLNGSNPGKSPLLAFPGGQHAQDVRLAYGLNLGPTPQGKYVVVGPLKSGKRGFIDPATGKLNGICKQDAGDIYGNTVVYEEIDGRILLIEVPSGNILARAQLKQAHLGDNRAITVSRDFSWLAASTRSRGAVWDISHNVRVQYVRAFTGGWFGEDGMFYAEFEDNDNDKDRNKNERSVVELNNLGGASTVFSIGGLLASQEGPYLLVRNPGKEGGGNQRKNWTYELRDFRSSKTLWTHHFPHEPPSLAVTPDYNAVVMAWPVWSDAAKDELKQFPDLKSAAEKEDMFYEVMDLKSGSMTGKLLVKTNKFSFQVRGVNVDGDWAAVQVSGDRVLVYSMTSGKEMGHVFGVAPVLSRNAGEYAVSSGEGEVDVYGLSDSQLRRTYKFPVSIVYKKFSDDGKQLFVLTRDQTAYVLDLNATPEAWRAVKATAQ
jgi:WD40 repeat protein